MDCTGISEEDYEYMMHWMGHEGNSALVPYFKEEGVDLRKNPVEFATYGMRGSGGRVWHNVRGETSLPGLFAAGDESIGSGIAEAASSGWIAGECAAGYAKEAVAPDRDADGALNQWKELLTDIPRRTIGPDWKEVNIALQQIMSDYAGAVRSESLLAAGGRHIEKLKKKAHETMVARNQHELVRGLEVLNLLDIGELVFVTARERKETRGLHVRTDYPFTNPLLDRLLVVKKVDGQPTLEWRKINR
jgi:succinate dehydrogenase/fumarate reductase flavoprotein subunit